MKIQEIYKKYKIMPQLADHQFKVAAVGWFLCDHLKAEADRDAVVKALLLHDMGNIIKFKLNMAASLFPKLFKAEDLEYWELVQKEFIEKYGKDEHAASVAIARELGVGQKVMELVDCVGFLEGQKNAASPSMERKICAYSDMRLAPGGVVSLEDRMSDLHQRYHGTGMFEPGDLTELFNNSLRAIEKQIFSQASITPGDITEQSISEIRQQLGNYIL